MSYITCQISYLSKLVNYQNDVVNIFSLENDGIFTYEHTISLSNLFYYSAILMLVSGILAALPDALAPKKLSIVKNQAYECGFDPFFLGESVIEIHFIIVALLFVIFDLEIVFLVPFATTLGMFGPISLFILFSYILIITIVFIFEWLEGGLSWPVWFNYKNSEN